MVTDEKQCGAVLISETLQQLMGQHHTSIATHTQLVHLLEQLGTVQ